MRKVLVTRKTFSAVGRGRHKTRCNAHAPVIFKSNYQTRVLYHDDDWSIQLKCRQSYFRTQVGNR